MCTSKAEGGQRCSSSTAKALSNATSRYERAVERYVNIKNSDGSPALRADARIRGQQAEWAWEDALFEHASTDAGRAEIEALRDDAPTYHQQGSKDARCKQDYQNALDDGAWLRQRRAEIKEAVRNGEMTPEMAEQRGAYPNDFAVEHRARQLESLRARELAAARPLVALPAGVSADEGERITDYYFSCENHNKPGECTVECAQLVSMTSPDESVEFDETGTAYGPPKPYTAYHYDEAQRASIAVVYTPDA